LIKHHRNRIKWECCRVVGGPMSGKVAGWPA
jgi:hypothetical protein